MKVILGIDPSGAYSEGKGTTGWCLMNQETKEVMDIGSVSAKDYPTAMQYYAANVDIIRYHFARYKEDLFVVMEDYLLYASAAQAQINSRMETNQLLGILKYTMFLKGIPHILEPANRVVNRWADPVLEGKGILQHGHLKDIPTFIPNDHEKDALRHALHYATFGTTNPEGDNTNEQGVSSPDPRELRGGTRSSSGFIPRGLCYAEEGRPGSNGYSRVSGNYGRIPERN